MEGHLEESRPTSETSHAIANAVAAPHRRLHSSTPNKAMRSGIVTIPPPVTLKTLKMSVSTGPRIDDRVVERGVDVADRRQGRERRGGGRMDADAQQHAERQGDERPAVQERATMIGQERVGVAMRPAAGAASAGCTRRCYLPAARRFSRARRDAHERPVLVHAPVVVLHFR